MGGRIGGPFRERPSRLADPDSMKHALSEAALPQGFRFSATACGLKKTGALDLALLSSDVPASAAPVFPKNLVVAAPVVSSNANLTPSNRRLPSLTLNPANPT